MTKLITTIRSRLSLLLAGSIVSASAASDQWVSIEKQSDKIYTVAANASVPGVPQALQTSANLHLWVDLQEEVQAPYSYSFDVTSFPERFFRLTPSTPPADPIRVVVVGDSMSSDCCGWGRGVSGFLKDNVTLVNYSQPQFSTKVFLQSAEYSNMVLIQPNYVLMQFGWSDGALVPGTSTSQVSLVEFRNNLQSIANTVREWGGIPIFVTLHAARSFDDNDKVIRTRQFHREVVVSLAAELNVPLIDLYQLTLDLFDKLGPQGCAFMIYDPTHPEDVMHISHLGSAWVAQLAVNQCPDSLGPYLTNIFEPQPKP